MKKPPKTPPTLSFRFKRETPPAHSAANAPRLAKQPREGESIKFQDLAPNLALDSGLPEAKAKAVLDIVAMALREVAATGQPLHIAGFGTFTLEPCDEPGELEILLTPDPPPKTPYS